MNNKIYDLLVEKGAVMSGHFVLTSGLHSNKYIEKFRVLEDPVSLQHICKKMANEFQGDSIDIVVGAAIGAILLSSGVAKELNVNGIFTERVDGEMVFKRGFSIAKGARVLVVEDIVTTGGSIKEIISLLESLNVDIVGISSLAHRGEMIDFGYKYHPLVEISIESWESRNVPEWLNNIPITKPGSTGK